MKRNALAAVWLAVLCGCNATSLEAPSDLATFPASAVRVIDGDTYEAQSERIRLIGWDTPETGKHAKCEQEAKWGKLATAKARQIIQGAETVGFQVEGRDRCNRALAHVAINGPASLGELLQVEGMAQRWTYPRERKPQWCGSGD